MITISTCYDHRARTKAGCEGPVELRITQGRKSMYIGTGVRVRKSQWAFDRVINRSDADALNERLGIMVNRALSYVNARLKAGEAVTGDEVKRALWNPDRSASLIEWMRSEVQQLDISDGTRKRYVTTIARLDEWGGMTAWPDVTVDCVLAFDAWLRTLNGRKARMSESGRHNYHKSLALLFRRAVLKELLTTNPYDRLRGEFGRGDRESTEYLTEEEVQAIVAMRPAEGSMMEAVRDLFVFQLYTGLAYQDTQAFDFSRYRKEGGHWRIIGTRIKTGEPYVSQLLPPALDVLERHGMTTPKISNQVYNRELKTLGVAAGVTTPLHSHLARHTFATMMLRMGVKIENLSKMLGHSNITRTQRYAKVLAQSVHEDFERVEEKLAKEKRRPE